MLGYHHAWKNEVFNKTFHFRNARVLTVTTSQKRISNMIEVGRAIDTRKRGLGMFLFGSHDIMKRDAPKDIFKRVWLSGKGEKTSILD